MTNAPYNGDSETLSARAALKEWAATQEALARGRQIILLRKGGLLDEEGVFTLEHEQFFFLPTWIHQATALLKPEHRDLLDEAPEQTREQRRAGKMHYFARVTRVYSLPANTPELLSHLPHIYSESYLDLRLSYKPEAPLLVVALRMFAISQPLSRRLEDRDLGCRSWVEWEEALVAAGKPVLNDQEFQAQLDRISLHGLDLARTERGFRNHG